VVCVCVCVCVCLCVGVFVCVRGLRQSKRPKYFRKSETPRTHHTQRSLTHPLIGIERIPIYRMFGTRRC